MELNPGHGSLQVFHFQPEEHSYPRCTPGGLCGPLPGVRVYGRDIPQRHPTEYHKDTGVGKRGEKYLFWT